MNLKITALLFAIFHVAISHIALPKMNKQDLFPFFTWDLFSYPEENVTFYQIKIHTLNENPLAQPLLFRDRPKSLKPVNSRVALFQITDFAQSIQNSEPSKSNLFKYEMERNIFNGYQKAKYQVLKTEVNSKDYLLSKKIISSTTIGFFQYDNSNSKK